MERAFNRERKTGEARFSEEKPQENDLHTVKNQQKASLHGIKKEDKTRVRSNTMLKPPCLPWAFFHNMPGMKLLKIFA